MGHCNTVDVTVDAAPVRAIVDTELKSADTPARSYRPSFCAVPIDHTVFAGPATRDEFDRIPLPEHVHDWQLDKVEALLANDGHAYERRCHSKTLTGPNGLMVIFQWFDVRRAEGGAA